MNSRHFISLLVLCLASLLSLPACTEAPSHPADPTIPDSVMADLVVEFHLAEARIDIFETEPHLKDSILAHYNVTPEAYERDMLYYQVYPDSLHAIFTNALDMMNDEQYATPKEAGMPR